MSNKVLNIEDVKLKTLQVEIKCLTINGKQMTLAVFRQLPIIKSDAAIDLNSVWGKVKYDLENYAWHFVVQEDDRLFRMGFRDGEIAEKHKEFVDKLPHLFIAV